MKNYKPNGKKKGYFIKVYSAWKRLNFDKGNDKNVTRWLEDSSGFLWAVERGVVIEGEEPIQLDPDDDQAQEILASGAPASTTAVSRGNASQRGRRRRTSGKKGRTGKTYDNLSNRDDKGRFQRPGGFVRPTPPYKNQPRYKGRFITPEELEKIGQLSVNRTLPRSEERDQQNADIIREFRTPRTQPQRRGGMDEQEFNQLADRLKKLETELEKLKNCPFLYYLRAQVTLLWKLKRTS